MGHVDGAEVAKHNSKNSCWIVLDSKAYDVTSFLSEHPGGAPIILKNAGTDATEEFKNYHPLDYLTDYLPSDALVGPINPNTFGQLRQPEKEKAAPVSDIDDSKEVPHLSLCVTASDFEKAAKAVLPHKSYTYASTSANTGLSLKRNLDDWGRISFRPRVMRNVGDVDTRRRIFGHSSPYPFYISPMGTMGAIHAGAEPEMIRGAVRKGAHVVVSTASSKSSEQIMQCFVEEQGRLKNGSPTELFYQYYMPVDRQKAIQLMSIVKSCGFKGLWITVDTPVLGKRTADRYLQAEEALAVGIAEESTAGWEAGGDNAFAPAMGGRPVQGQLSPHTTWEDLEWIRKEWEGPIVLKGVQCAEDAKLAMEYGCNGILLSNHGGRQLHTAPSALMTLLEIRAYCPEVLGKLEIFLDGGLRDGNDVLKALCLGATAVGVGRPFLYALGAYGTKGVERCVDVLAEELQTGMRLLGITSLDQCRPEMVNASRLLNEMWRPEQLSIKSRL
ncbi:mitochondrial cytochrome-like protein b2 [Cucurbitaria berberidis CBS 394.84]|uniref:Mitochondrial cytochrome-like protein b2 n=1 Tax=Cucurbitaria berberidis CBS 394.84 TaxID=1168544 RepID=A0A9P4GJI1_9PLEO|nr:mitochondrial cytochrome-like protein b2 [Cucurbitaria berberidis CBS 394.84]KAF1846541.1 mitochondrial cytochrome-like protein b2 [Cucurbitaria berberidis CBS 394.84]